MRQPSHWSVLGAVLASLMPIASALTQSEVSPNDNNAQQVLTPAERLSTSRPNIVFILTDDQDLHMNSLDYVPLINKHLIDRGTLYKKHFCTTAICCPARVSILTGKLSHNTNVTDIAPPYGMPLILSRILLLLNPCRRVPQVYQQGVQRELPFRVAARCRI
jgi:Sulfatase